MNSNVKDLIFPETRSERIKRLEESRNILKSEFIGLDDIIDELIKDISPWYITPEVIERPVVISLFGMSGTGKTSVVKKIVNLLGLSGKAIFFDCGEESNESSSSSLSDKIIEGFGVSDDNNYELALRESVFVFDEFQYARTIDEQGNEVIKPTLRPIWNVIDSGVVNFNVYNFVFNKFYSLLEYFSSFGKENSEIKLVNGEIQDRGDVKKILLAIGLFHYDRNINELLKGNDKSKMSSHPVVKSSSDNFDDEEEDILAPLKVLERNCVRAIIKRFNSISPGLGFKKVMDLNSLGTVGELCEALKKMKEIISAPRSLNCSGSLVFIIGNLDEAFHVQSDLSPDVDADTFYYQTSSVSISDIKEALKTRFRAEQIARFGNNLIKYPTLRKKDFEKVIEKELKRITDKFFETEGIKVNISKGVKDLLYFEGVFPSQGVRPVFTTIGSFFSPLLSDIIIGKENGLIKGDSVNIKISLEDTENLNFNKSNIDIVIEFSKEKGGQLIKTINLQLGPLRDPARRSTRYCNAVHESGHAIVSMYETGEVPINIVAVSSGDGGFCDTYNKSKEGEIETREEVDGEVRTLLAGYLAEEEVFKDKNKCLMGSSSDINRAWEYFSDMSYKTGYFQPISFSSYSACNFPDGIPFGISDDGIYVSGRNNLQEAVQQRFRDFISETRKILKSEKRLLKYLSLELGEKGSLTKDRILEIVKEYGNVLGEDYLKMRKGNLSGNWYLDILKEY